MLDLLRVSSLFPSSGWSAGCVSSAHWEESYPPAKASFDSPQTAERLLFTRVPYSLAFSRILVCPSVLNFLQTCLFFSRLCVCLKAGPGNAQKTSVSARRGLSECGTGAALADPLLLLLLSGQASSTGL
ncbi:hypothetical protein QQF64_006074 [Cirrhinus molitorella]|uniref:Uncharacterized protein n=1 Tax=Cirrhinus molitorella TaxID=172907 RepID=A0ABR3MFG5_9TELE